MNELLSTDDRRFTATVEDWLRESTDVIVERYNPSLTSDHALYLINSTEHLRALTRRCRKGDMITVVGGKHLPIRGFVDEELISRAEQALGPDSPFVVMTPNPFPACLTEIASGTGTRVLRRTLSELIGTHVWVGESIRFVAPDDMTATDEGRYLFARKMDT